MGGVLTLDHQKNFKRLLEILGFEVDKFQPINRPVQFENIILPDESFFLDGDGRKFTKEYREAIDCVRDFALKNQTPTSSKKIYYFYGRAQVGEERLAEYFRSKGYEIISPENLTLDEQLNLLINAESFASTIGSCSHNAIFLRDGTEVIFIPRSANRLTGYQLTLDQLHPLNVNYVDSSLSLFENFNGPYCFVISEQLKRFFGDDFENYSEEDFKIFLAYVRDAVNHGFKENKEAQKYYFEHLQKFFAQLKQHADLMTTYGVKLL